MMLSTKIPQANRFRVLSVSCAALLMALACGSDKDAPSKDTNPSGNGDGDGDLPGDGDGDLPGDGDGDLNGTGGGSPGKSCGSIFTSDSGVAAESSIATPSLPVSPFIVVDQFGYLPDSEKIAVLRDPQAGFDSGESFAPGATLELIDATTEASVLTGTAEFWGAGATHDASGDMAWHFDFSSVTTPGLYYVRDTDNNVRSDVFRVASDVYRNVLKHAVRSFFYQRAGFEKTAEFAGANWADGASHVGLGQDRNARLYSDLQNAATERDLSGGWYDAGDYNKYTAWTADYIAAMARAYLERPEVFSDDYGIPESNNCVPDLLDEMRFGVEHLLRLQEADGSVLSIVDLAGASPPSAATDPSRYGPASTNSTIRSATAYASAALALETFDSAFAAELKTAAEAAWSWALAHPGVEFANNNGSNNLGAGQQEPDATYVTLAHLPAALALYRATGDSTYKTYFESNFNQPEYHLFQSGGGWLSGYHLEFTDAYLEYIALPDADATLAESFVTPFNSALGGANNLGALTANPDPYLAHMDDVGWGSNSLKSNIGLLLYSYVENDLDPTRVDDAARAAARYVHAIHGVNPLGLVYLSNMGDEGAYSSVTQFYHSWFADGTDWDEVGVSAYGPPPGFLVGGPNAGYNWDASCPGQTGCGAAPPSPPFGQPALKSYAQFNDNWPLNSWEVTENSNGYQLAYIRLLSKFVN